MDATAKFFAGLAEPRREPLLANASGSIRIELRQGKRTEARTVVVDRGEVRLTDTRDATCRIAADRELFNRLVSGQTNAVAAMLRGAVAVEGDLELLILFQRTLPGPRR